MFLRGAFNALTRLNSRPTYMKRLDTEDYVSPIRLCPSRYFKTDHQSISSIDIEKREMIVPVDSILGSQTIQINFSAQPSSGQFNVVFPGFVELDALPFDLTGADFQTALRAGYPSAFSKVKVVGNTVDYIDGFTITFHGLLAPAPTGIFISSNTTGVEVTPHSVKYVPWPGRKLKRGDRIEDTVLGTMPITNVTEITDLGGDIMGFRCIVE